LRKVSEHTLSLLQYKDIAISPYLRIESSSGYIYHLSTDNTIIPDENIETDIVNVYGLIDDMPRVRESVDIVESKKFTITSLKVKVRDSSIESYKFGEMLREHPIQGQKAEYKLWPLNADIKDAIAIYEGRIRSVRKSKGYVTIEVENRVNVVSKIDVPQRLINQDDQTYQKYNGKPVPMAYGSTLAYALITNADGSDMKCQVDTDEQYQNIPYHINGGIPDTGYSEVAEFHVASGKDNLSHRIAPFVDSNANIQNNFCAVNALQYVYTNYGVSLQGSALSPWHSNTLFVRYDAFPVSANTFCPQGENSGAWGEGGLNENGQAIKYRPIYLDGLDSLYTPSGGYMYMESYEGHTGTAVDDVAYGVYYGGVYNDYRIGLSVSLEQPKTSLIKVEEGVTQGMTAKVRGTMSAGWSHPGEPDNFTFNNAEQGGQSKQVRIRLRNNENTDADDDIHLPQYFNDTLQFYAGAEHQGTGWTTNYSGFTNAEKLLDAPAGGIWIDVAGTPNLNQVNRAMWLQIASIYMTYGFFIDDAIGQQYYLDTGGRLDNIDLKYTSGNETMQTYIGESGQLYTQITQHLSGGKKIFKRRLSQKSTRNIITELLFKRLARKRYGDIKVKIDASIDKKKQIQLLADTKGRENIEYLASVPHKGKKKNV